MEDVTEELTPQASGEKRQSTARSSISDSYGTSPTSTSNSSLPSKNSQATTIDSKPLDSRASTFSSISAESNSPNGNRRPVVNAVANAAATAKKWGLDALAARRTAQAAAKEAAAAEIAQPMGRGRPLPPPGVPLPPPDKRTKTAPIPVPRRKLAPAPASVSATSPTPHSRFHDERQAPSISYAKADSDARDEAQAASISYRKMPPALPKRHAKDDNQAVFVVDAPEADSEPSTPSHDTKQSSYMQARVEYGEDIDAPRSKMKVEHSPTTQLWRDGDDETDETPPNLPARNQSSRSSTPPLPRRRRVGRSISSSPGDDDQTLPSWAAAQEEEARSKSMWVDEDSGNLHQ